MPSSLYARSCPASLLDFSALPLEDATMVKAPDVPNSFLEKWQSLVDLLAEILKVPAAVITKADAPDLEILKTSRTAGNPLSAGAVLPLSNQYCNRVVRRKTPYKVVSAAEDIEWMESDPLNAGLLAYLGYPLLLPSGDVFGTICVFDTKTNSFGDLYDKVLQQFKNVVESHLLLIVQNGNLEEALEQKETLMREVHHRTKNNLTMIRNLLDLQLSELTDPLQRKPLEESRDRIMTFAMIHEMLHGTKLAHSVNMNEYLQSLTKKILAGYPAYADKAEITTSFDSIVLNADRALPVGLIANELLTNALRHGSKKGGNNKITFSLLKGPGKDEVLEVRDSGPGLPPGFEIEKTSSLGVRLVKMLARQLDGALSFRNEGGAVFTIQFPGQE